MDKARRDRMQARHFFLNTCNLRHAYIVDNISTRKEKTRENRREGGIDTWLDNEGGTNLLGWIWISYSVVRCTRLIHPPRAPVDDTAQSNAQAKKLPSFDKLTINPAVCWCVCVCCM